MTFDRESLRQQLEMEEAELRLALAQEELLKRCRDDINAFCEYVFPGIKQQPFHRRLQNLANTHRKLVIDAPIEHGKTFQFSILRPLWILGRNPHETLAIIGNATEGPERCLDVIRAQIHHNERLHEVFPKMKLRESTKHAITVDRGITADKDPSIVAIGINGSIIGRRWSGIILDDFIDFDNSWTEAQRLKTWKVLESTVLGRLIQSGWIVDIGTPWYNNDARARHRKLPGYHYEHNDAMDMLWPETYKDPETGKVYGWPKERLDDKRRSMSEFEWSRQFRCRPLSETLAVFTRDSIDSCLELGRGLPLGRPAEENDIVVTGVDLAIKKADTADETVFVTGRIRNGRKEVLDIRSGHWELTDILREVLRTVRRYPHHAGFRVESNAGQSYIIQALGTPDVMRAIGCDDGDLARIRIVPHNTSSRKHDPIVGIRGLAVDFEHQRVTLPCSADGHPEDEMRELIAGLISYDPISHTPDRVMAFYLFAEEARRYWSADGAGTWGKYGII